MDYNAVTAVLTLLAVAAPLSLVLFHSLSSGADLISSSLARTVVAATAAVQVVITVPLLSGSIPEGENGGPIGAFLGGMFVLAIGFGCERYIAMGGFPGARRDQKPVVQ